MAENLLCDSWADLDQADLRLLFQERFGRPGQYDGDENVIHLPLAREECRVSLTYKGAKREPGFVRAISPVALEGALWSLGGSVKTAITTRSQCGVLFPHNVRSLYGNGGRS